MTEDLDTISQTDVTEEGYSPILSEFITRMRAARARRLVPDPETPLIEVDEAIRRIAGLYERTRNTLEYGEADALRRRAIERSLRRIVNFGTGAHAEDKAIEILRELIRAGYFPNRVIPQSIARPLGRILEQVVAAARNVEPFFHDELISFAAFAVEDTIFPERAAAQRAVVQFVIETCEERLRWPETARTERGHQAFLFVAAHRVVLRADSRRIVFAFLRETLPEWFEADAAEVAALAPDFERVLVVAKRTVTHPRTEQYIRAVRRFAPAFLALDEAVAGLVREDAGEVSVMQLERRVEESVASLVQLARQKLKIAAVRATLYVFLTKMVIGLAIELPYERIVLDESFSQPFLINLLFPPALMALVALATRPPKAEVADRIVTDALRLATGEGTVEHVRLPAHRGTMRLTAFIFATVILGGAALYFLLSGLQALGFEMFSMVIFLMFFSIISLFAWRVRRPLVEDLNMTPGGGVVGTFLEVLMFPFLAFGRVLSGGFRKVNVFIFLLDVFIETPLKFFFSTGEDWIAFLREKREELIEE